MATCLFDNFENGTSNWTLDSGVGLGTDVFWSPTHSLSGSVGGSLFATYDTVDNINGNVQINQYVYVESLVSQVVWNGCVWRASLSPLSSTNNTYYWAYVVWNANQDSLVFGKTILGVKTTITSLNCTTGSAPFANCGAITNSNWVNINVSMKAANFVIWVKSMTTGYYLGPSGAMQSTPCYAINWIDSSIPPISGYFGIWMNCSYTSQYSRTDNFNLSTPIQALFVSPGIVNSSAIVTHKANASLFTGSALIVTGRVTHKANASLFTVSALAASGQVIYKANASLFTGSALIVTGRAIYKANASLFTVSALAASEILSVSRVFDNFENGTSNWTLDSGTGLVTTQAFSPTHSISNSGIGFGNGFATYNLSNNYGSNVHINIYFYLTATTFASCVWGGSSFPMSSANYYYGIQIQSGSGSSNDSLIFFNVNAGTQTSIRIVQAASGVLTGKWFNIDIRMNSVMLVVQVQDQTTKYWLTGSGVMQSAQANVFANTYTHLSETSGYFGIQQDGSFIDDFSLYMDFGQAGLMGNSALVAKAKVTHNAHIALLTGSTSSAKGQVAHKGKAILFGNSTLYAKLSTTFMARATLDSSTLFDCHASLTAEAITILIGGSTLYGNASVINKANAIVNVTSSLTSSVNMVRGAKAILISSARLTSEAYVTFAGITAIVCNSVLVTNTNVLHLASINFVNGIVLKANAAASHHASIGLVGIATLLSVVRMTHNANAGLVGGVTLVVVPKITYRAKAALIGVAALAATTKSTYYSSAHLIGVAVLKGTARPTILIANSSLVTVATVGHRAKATTVANSSLVSSTTVNYTHTQLSAAHLW